MKVTAFNAVCPFEIGDKVRTADGVQTITDIACVHYCRSGEVKFMYELIIAKHMFYLQLFRRFITSDGKKKGFTTAY